MGKASGQMDHQFEGKVGLV